MTCVCVHEFLVKKGDQKWGSGGLKGSGLMHFEDTQNGNRGQGRKWGEKEGESQNFLSVGRTCVRV